MEKNKKKKYYYDNNKKYYHRKRENKEEQSKNKNTYEKLVNVRSDVLEVEDNKVINDNDYSVMKLVAISIIIVAIIFSSLLLLHWL